MIGTRHVGYFIAHTVKPLIEELDKLMGKCENLKFDKMYCSHLIEILVKLELKKALLYCVTYLLIAGALCIAMWVIVG